MQKPIKIRFIITWVLMSLLKFEKSSTLLKKKPQILQMFSIMNKAKN